MKKKTYFITGTDTEVGKTFVTVALLRAAQQLDLATLALKPIAAGADDSDAGLTNEDALALMEHMTVQIPYAQVNPAVYKTPASPHIAAAIDNKRITISRLAGICRGALLQPFDIGFVEGAGGWRVPVNERENLSQLPLEMNLPVILVVGMRLGCLNHALLTVEAIQRDGLELAGWVANCIDPEMGYLEENIQTLRSAIKSPCLGVIPHLSGNESADPGTFLKIDFLLEADAQ